MTTMSIKYYFDVLFEVMHISNKNVHAWIQQIVAIYHKKKFLKQIVIWTVDKPIGVTK